MHTDLGLRFLVQGNQLLKTARVTTSLDYGQGLTRKDAPQPKGQLPRKEQEPENRDFI